MSKPELECDLIMKGGVTSGVVYPRILTVLKDSYRFRSIGGTSAGAISAVVAAAAEYSRQTGKGTGFEGVEKIPKEIGAKGRLLSMFQPRPEFKTLLKFITHVKPAKGFIGFLKGVVFALWPYALLGAAPGLFLIWYVEKNLYAFWLGIVLALLGMLIVPLVVLYFLVFKRLPARGFGICTGKTSKGAKHSAITDWLSDQIDAISGERPFLHSHATSQGIDLRTITTDISTRRPYSLPLDNNFYFFSKAEFSELFPDHVVEHLAQTRVTDENCDGGYLSWKNPKTGETVNDFYWLQNTDGDLDHLPVIVMARMSLSFPFLFSAVPLYRIDHTKKGSRHENVVRCLFSDGGLSSNFPIHLFDSILPSRPTFGISLTEHSEDRKTIGKPRPGDDEQTAEARTRVALPVVPGDGDDLPAYGIDSIVGFVMAMFYSAKDWQDTLQSILPGYRDRIVSIALLNCEGGLNLSMTPETVKRLILYGQLAGEDVLEKFNLREHRWRRYRTGTAALEKTVRAYHARYCGMPQEGELLYEELVRRNGPPDVAPDDKTRGYRANRKQREEMISRSDEISKLGKWLSERDPMENWTHAPKSRSSLRNIAEMGAEPSSQPQKPEPSESA